MEAANSQADDRSAELLTKATDALLDLLNTPEMIFISNQSMRELITGFSSTLDQALKDGTEDQLFIHWQNQMPEAKKRLLKEAKREPLRLADGREMPVLFEQKARNFLNDCPPFPNTPKLI